MVVMICADNGAKSDALQTKGGPRKSLRSHPLFFGITMGLLSEIINSRYVFLLTWYLVWFENFRHQANFRHHDHLGF